MVDIWQNLFSPKDIIFYTDNSLTDKNTRHSYCLYYNNLFLEIQTNTINLLEIGVDKGGSLIMWSKWFKNGSIYGIDVIPKPQLLKNYKNITYLQKDAYSEESDDFKDLFFDIIIDDGPHTLSSQIKFIKKYNKKIKNNGFLIIEDINSKQRYETLCKYIDRSSFNIFPLYIGHKNRKAKDPNVAQYETINLCKNAALGAIGQKSPVKEKKFDYPKKKWYNIFSKKK
jgi:hypothetical protein